MGDVVRFYLLLAICVAFFCASCAGVRYGVVRGARECAIQEQVNTNEVIKIQKAVNAEVFNRGVGDIRDILRKKYTIAE